MARFSLFDIRQVLSHGSQAAAFADYSSRQWALAIRPQAPTAKVVLVVAEQIEHATEVTTLEEEGKSVKHSCVDGLRMESLQYLVEQLRRESRGIAIGNTRASRD